MASIPDMQREALDLAAMGWRVFPLHPVIDGRCSCGGPGCDAGKHPAIRGWQDAATTNAHAITGWWARWPSGGIGVATGKRSRVVVIDVDRERGADALFELEQTYEPLPPTVDATTGSGRHVYFQCPDDGLASSVGRLGPGLDIRGDGGFVVVPPTLHRSGRRYAWDNAPGDIELAELPEWLAAVLRTVPERPQHTAREAVEAGGRNNALIRAAGALVRAGFAPTVIGEALHALNRDACKPPLAATEVDRIAASALRFREPPPWERRPAEFIAHGQPTPYARLLLWALVAHADRDGLTFPGYRRLSRVTGIHQRRIKALLNELEGLDRIEVVRRSRKRGNRYRLCGDVSPIPLCCGGSASTVGSKEAVSA